ncbi:MAG: hypothetical protein KTR32_18780 [Granulosicoccus sp.]|nr:hypothetical protein [Granulosicoccus sp.]
MNESTRLPRPLNPLKSAVQALKIASIFTLLVVAYGCAQTPKNTAPVEVPEETPSYWSYSRVVNTNNSMVSLFDPVDLIHHEDDPDDWYLYDYGHDDDLKSGRFAATLLEHNGKIRVRVTEAPLTAQEQAAAGPRATLRLRVRNSRMLLSGGDTWPSEKTSATRYAYDNRWIAIPNGDYRVTITALDRRKAVAHDVVFQLKEVFDIVDVRHAPGFPQLVVGQNAAVVGINAQGFNFNEQCSRVPGTAEWTPLTVSKLPMPGAKSRIDISQSIFERGQAMQRAGKNATMPVVLSQNTLPGSVGVYIEPSQWQDAQPGLRGVSSINVDILCAVEITGAETSQDRLKLKLRPLPFGQGPLPANLASELANRFNNWARYTNIPGWRFKGSQALRAVNHRSLVNGVMRNLNLSPRDAESLLSLNNEARAIKILDRMPVRW